MGWMLTGTGWVYSADTAPVVVPTGTTSALILNGNYTVATLPDPVANAKKYAWVTDLHDGNPDLCLSDGTVWKPVRPNMIRTLAAATMTLTALVNSPTQTLTGALSTLQTITLSTTNAYKGAKFRVNRKATGLGGLSVGGITLALNSWADFEYDGSTWVQTASGSLL